MYTLTSDFGNMSNAIILFELAIYIQTNYFIVISKAVNFHIRFWRFPSMRHEKIFTIFLNFVMIQHLFILHHAFVHSIIDKAVTKMWIPFLNIGMIGVPPSANFMILVFLILNFMIFMIFVILVWYSRISMLFMFIVWNSKIFINFVILACNFGFRDFRNSHVEFKDFHFVHDLGVEFNDFHDLHYSNM